MAGGKVLGLGSKLAQAFSQVEVELVKAKNLTDEQLARAKEFARKVLQERANDIALAVLTRAIEYEIKDQEKYAKSGIKALNGFVEKITTKFDWNTERLVKLLSQGWEPTDLELVIDLYEDDIDIEMRAPNGAWAAIHIVVKDDREFHEEEFIEVDDTMETLRNATTALRTMYDSLKEEIEELEEELSECRKRLEECDCPEEEDEEDEY